MKEESKPAWKWVSLGVLLICLLVVLRFLPLVAWMKTFIEWIEQHGVAGLLVFVGGYVLGTLLFVPGSLLTISAGIAFGILWGTALASLSATVGAALAFLIARYVARGAIERRAEKSEQFKAIDSAIGEQGWKIVALLRLSPVIPFNLSNYFYGLTSIKFWPYVFASWAGMLPGTLLYVYLGHIGKATLGGHARERSTQEYIFLGAGLAATIAATIFLTRLAKRTLQKTREAIREKREKDANLPR